MPHIQTCLDLNGTRGTKQSSNQVRDFAANMDALWHLGQILPPWFPSGEILVGQPNTMGIQTGIIELRNAIVLRKSETSKLTQKVAH